MRRIPIGWLNQTVSYSARSGTDDYGDPTFSTAQDLTHVRIEYNVKTVLNSLGESITDDAVLYYDPAQSSPAGLTFPRKSKITFNNDSFILRQAEPKYDEQGILHHWELRLIGNES